MSKKKKHRPRETSSTPPDTNALQVDQQDTSKFVIKTRADVSALKAMTKQQKQERAEKERRARQEALKKQQLAAIHLAKTQHQQPTSIPVANSPGSFRTTHPSLQLPWRSFAGPLGSPHLASEASFSGPVLNPLEHVEDLNKFVDSSTPPSELVSKIEQFLDTYPSFVMADHARFIAKVTTALVEEPLI